MENPSEFDDKRRRALFGSHADSYRDGRPGYPPAVFEHLRRSCGLTEGCRLLEIGPGAGQATELLLDAGAEVLAIEVAAEFASLLAGQFAGRSFEVLTGEFESIDMPAGAFDIVAAATSFHWIEPGAGLDRAARLLAPGGSLALWWNHYGDPNRADPFRDAVQPLLEQLAPHLADAVVGGAGIGAHPYALEVEARTGEIDDSRRFGPVEHVMIPWTVTQTADEMQRFLASFSHWMALEPQVRSELLTSVGDLIDTQFGGAVDRPFLTSVFTARRS